MQEGQGFSSLLRKSRRPRLVFCRPGPGAGSLPKLAVKRCAEPEPMTWPRVAYSSGSDFGRLLPRPVAPASGLRGRGPSWESESELEWLGAAVALSTCQRSVNTISFMPLFLIHIVFPCFNLLPHGSRNVVQYKSESFLPLVRAVD